MRGPWIVIVSASVTVTIGTYGKQINEDGAITL